MSEALRKRRAGAATGEVGAERTAALPTVLPPPPPSVRSLQRLETLSNLLSPSTPAFSFDTPPTVQFFFSVFAVLLPIRVLSALYAPIQDCDEVYNYW